MTKKPSEKNKTWEKDRRDRMNKCFDKLLKLLPNYDPSITCSKIEIIQKSIDHIENLHKKHEDYLKCKDPSILNEYETLIESLRYYQVRNSQLADLLKNANIKLPAFDLPKLLKENSKYVDENNDIFKLKEKDTATQDSKITENAAKKLDKKSSTTRNRQSKVTNKTLNGCKKLSNTQLNVKNNFNDYLNYQKDPNIIDSFQNTGLNTTTRVLIPVNIIPLQQSVTNATILPLPVPSEVPSLVKLNNIPQSTKCIKNGIRYRTGKQKILPKPFIKLYYRRSDGKIPIPLLKRRIIGKPKFRRKRKPKNSSLLLSKEESNEIKINNNKKIAGEQKNRSVSPTAAFLLTFPVVSTSSGKHAENLENFNNFFTTKEYTNYCDQNKKENTVINEKIISKEMEASNTICTSNMYTPTSTSISSDTKTSFCNLPKTISTQGLAPICTPLPLDTKISSLLTSQLSLETKKQLGNDERISLPRLVPTMNFNQLNLNYDQNLKYAKSYTDNLMGSNNTIDFDSNWISKPIKTSLANHLVTNQNYSSNDIVGHTDPFKNINDFTAESKILDSININKENFKTDKNKMNNDSSEKQTSSSNANSYMKTLNNTQLFNANGSQLFELNTSTITTSSYQSSLPSLLNVWSSNTYSVPSAEKSVSCTPTSSSLFQGNLPGNDRILTKPSTTKPNKTNKKNTFKLDFLTNTSTVLPKHNYLTATTNQSATCGHLHFDAVLPSETINLPTTSNNQETTNYLDAINKKGLLSLPPYTEFCKTDDVSNTYPDLFQSATTSKTLSTCKTSRSINELQSCIDTTDSNAAVAPLMNTIGTQNNNFYYPLQSQQTATTFCFNLTTQSLTNTKPKKIQSKSIVSYPPIKSDVPWIQPPLPTPNVPPIGKAEYKSSFTFSLTPSTNIVSKSNNCQNIETKVSKSISNSQISTSSESYPTTSFTFSLTTPRSLDPIFVGSSNRSDMYPSTQLQGKLWEEHPTATNFTFALTKPSQTKNISHISSNTSSDTKSKLFSTQFYDCEQLKTCKTSQKVHGHVNWMTSSTPTETLADFSSSTIGPSGFGHYSNTNRELCFSKKDSHLNHTTDDNQFLAWSPNKANHVHSNNINYGCYATNTSGVGGDGGGEYNYNSVPHTKETRNNSTANFFSVSQLVDNSTPIASSDLNEFNIETNSNKYKTLTKFKEHNQKKDQYLKQAISNNYSAEALISKKEKHRNLASMHSNGNFYNHNNNNSYNSNFQTTEQNYNSGNYLYNYPATNQNCMTTTDQSDYLDGAATSSYTNNDILSYGKEKKNLFPPIPTANTAQSYDSTTMNLFPVPIIPSGTSTTNSIEHLDPSGLHHHGTHHASPQYPSNYQSSANWTTSAIGGGYQTNQIGLSYSSTIETNVANQNVSANLPNFNLSSICPEINEKVDSHVW